MYNEYMGEDQEIQQSPIENRRSEKIPSDQLVGIVANTITDILLQDYSRLDEWEQTSHRLNLDPTLTARIPSAIENASNDLKRDMWGLREALKCQQKGEEIMLRMVGQKTVIDVEKYGDEALNRQAKQLEDFMASRSSGKEAA